MAAALMKGKELALKIIDEVKEEVHKLEANGQRKPGLAVIIVGSDESSQIYIRKKQEVCSECGIYSEKHELKENTTENELLDLIKRLNSDRKIDGILVQLPLPKHINEKKIIEAIDPSKDVDGFHPVNVGKLSIGYCDLLPCTPKGVIKLLKEYKIDVKGKDCVVVGRSNIVGKPMAMLLLSENATVTVCHSQTKDLAKHTKEADIILSAVGKPGIIKADMIKKGAVVVDIGTTRVDGKLKGDVDFENAKEKASYITPVPNGVGPLTVAILMKNTMAAYHLLKGRE